jgi:signal transduction histidine kinase/ActR/RegA family two-component response regulator
VFRSCLDRLPLATHRAVENTDLRLDLEGADHQLREVEHRFQALADLVTAGVAIEGADGILHANQGLASMLGAGSSLELLGRTLVSCVPAELRAALMEKMQNPPGPDAPLQMDLTFTGLDGHPVQAALSGVEIGFHGQPARLYVVTDRREQRRVESAIASLATFAQENPNPILMFSTDARVTYYNAAALEMAHSLGREHPSACLPPQAASIIEECLITGQKRQRVHWTQNKRTFSWSFFPHATGGVVHAFVMETTDQVALEAQLHHSQRLEAVGRLAAGVGHEFNNLLTVIRGQADVLCQLNQFDAKSREAMQQLLHAIERAGRITLQLQAFSRRSPVRLEPLDLNEVLGKLADLLRTTLREDIRLTVRLAESLPAVQGDRALLEQAFLNLAISARDRMPKGGELVLSSERISFPEGTPLRQAEARHGDFVRVCVADNGAAIEPALLPYLFEPLFGARDSESVSGLGLSTSHGILKQHHGWIEVSSAAGSGTRFEACLPVIRSRGGTEREEPRPAGLDPSRHRVLIVEDDPAVRWTLKSMLEHAGYGVVEASNPLEALGVWRVRQAEITILLTDLVMPTGITGQELATHLLQSKPDLRVVYTSGYCVESVAQGTAIEPGVNFLQKPFDALAFNEAILRQQAALI